MLRQTLNDYGHQNINFIIITGYGILHCSARCIDATNSVRDFLKQTRTKLIPPRGVPNQKEMRIETVVITPALIGGTIGGT